MADATKTGTAFLDAWLAAMAPLSTAAPSDAGFARWSDAAASFAGSWSELAQRSFGAMAAIGEMASGGDPLGEALEQSFGVAGEVGGTAADVPTALAEAAAVTSRLFAAREAYRAFMMSTWQRAFEELMREALAQSAAGTLPGTPAKWLAFSTSIADRVFVDKFNSDAYLQAQRRLSSALADQRRSEMTLVETFAQSGHFPTRRALDEVGAEVNELRRRVRRLERTLREKSAGRGRSKKSGDRAPESEAADAG